MNEEIKRYILSGNLEKALELASNHYPNDIFIILLRSRYSQLKNNSIAGVLSQQEYDIELSLIKKNLIEELSKNKAVSKRYIFSWESKYISIFLAFFIVFFYYIFNNNSTPNVNNIDGNNNTIINSLTQINNVDTFEVADYFSINYGRLFGGYQVPLLINSIFHNNQSKIGNRDSICIGLPFYSDLVGDEIEHFWSNLDFKDSKIVKTNVLDQIIDCNISEEFWGESSQYMLLYIGNKSHPTLAPFFFYQNDTFHNTYDDSYQPVKKGTIKTYYDFMCSEDDKIPDIYEKCEKNSDNIGFLILLLENTSKNNLFDIQFKFTEYKISNWQELNSNHIDMILNDRPIDYQENKIIPFLKCGEKILLLLSVYIKDSKGYPSKYLTNIVKPIEIKYRVQGKKEFFKQQIRPPLKEKAFKVKVPFGWYWQ